MINLATPIVVPAIAEKSYPEIWIRNFTVTVTGPNADDPAVMTVNYAAAGNRDSSGNGEFAPDYIAQLTIPNIFATAGADPEFGQLFQAVLGKLIELGVQNGVISVQE